METEFAITEFVDCTEKPKIPCILKHRYTDFIVQEISLDETVVSKELSFDDPPFRKKEVERPNFITDELVAELNMLRGDDVYHLKLPAGHNKYLRKQVHAFINSQFGRRLISNLKNGEMEISVLQDSNKRKASNGGDLSPPEKRLKDSENLEVKTERLENILRPDVLSEADVAEIFKVDSNKVDEFTKDVKYLNSDQRNQIREYVKNKFPALQASTIDGIMTIKKSKSVKSDRRHDRNWPKDLYDHVHFTLAKEDKDTSYALGIVAKFSGLNPSLFAIAGTKDRRAVTYQRVSVYRVEPKRLLNLNKNLNGIRLGNFTYAKDPLSLGKLWGNRFSIVLRNFPDNLKADIESRIEVWKTLGFINYFGSQRFGTCEINTAEIGRLILAQKWDDAVKMILKPRQAENYSPLQKCLQKYSETNDADAVLKEYRFLLSSHGIEITLLKHLRKEPNAYKMAIRSLPRNTRSLYVHAYQSWVFNRVASKRILEHGKNLMEGDIDMNGCLTDNIDKVALPLPTATINLETQVGQMYKKILKEDKVTLESFSKLTKEFAIGDDVLRPFIGRPKNVEFGWLNYSRPDEDIQDGLCSYVAATPQGPFLALRIQFSLPSGTYATIALRELLRVDLSSAYQKTLGHEEMDESIVKDCSTPIV